MAMHFPSIIKGRVAESLLTALLERSGYRVTRLGIETLWDEVKHLDYEQYRKLALPDQLRSLPDLLVADADIENAYLVEVKLRRRFDAETARELHDTLRTQHTHWPQAIAVIMLSEPAFQHGRYHQDFIRVLPLKAVSKLVDSSLDTIKDERVRMRALWEGMLSLQDVFRYFHQNDANRSRGYTGQQNADLITTTLKDLANLS